MPTYDYRCSACGKTFERVASVGEYSKGLKPSCPFCGSAKTVRALDLVNVKTRSKTARDADRFASGCSCASDEE